MPLNITNNGVKGDGPAPRVRAGCCEPRLILAEPYDRQSVDVGNQYGTKEGSGQPVEAARPRFQSSRRAVTTGRRAARQAGNSPPSSPIATE